MSIGEDGKLYRVGSLKEVVGFRQNVFGTVVTVLT